MPAPRFFALATAACLLALCAGVVAGLEDRSLLQLALSPVPSASVCMPNANATEALKPVTTPTPYKGDIITLAVTNVTGVGYTFLASNLTIQHRAGGGFASRGLVLLPEVGVDPAAYAPYARATALLGYFAVLAADRSYETILRALALQPDLQYWVLGGHGQGGTVVAGLVKVLQPKVKGLALLAAALPASVNLSTTNVFVISAYGTSDSVVTPQQVLGDAASLPGDALVVPLGGLGHFDVIYSQCSGNDGASMDGSRLTAEAAEAATMALSYSVWLAQWYEATPRALSFGDNALLRPGLNDSKPYPSGSTGLVTFSNIPIPDTLPERHWYVFAPPANKTSGGYIFLPGAAVDARAYFPVAFQIAARGWLVTIIEVTARLAVLNSTDPTTVINSTNPVFAPVPRIKWAVGGHSAGGQGAAAYVAANPSGVFALIMLAGSAMPLNLTLSTVPVVNIVGSLDRVGGPTDGSYLRYDYEYVRPFVNPNMTLPLVVIEGGNHYQVGDYGYQFDDMIPSISQDEQQFETGEKVVQALKKYVPN